MGLIRGGLFFITAILIFIVVIIGNVFLMISLSLDYDNVNSELKEIISNIDLDGTNIVDLLEEDLVLMQNYCTPNNTGVLYNNQVITIPCDIINNNGNVSEYVKDKYKINDEEQLNLIKIDVEENKDYHLENCKIKDSFNTTYFNYSVAISCTAILNGSEAILNESIDKLSLTIYEDSYGCDNLIQCFRESDGKPFFILSRETKEYFDSKFYQCLGVLALLILMLIVFVEKKTNVPIVLGVIIAIASAPFLKLYELVAYITRWDFIEFFRIFFTKSMEVFWISFIIGIILIVLGVLIKVFSIGLKVEGFIAKRFKEKNKKL